MDKSGGRKSTNCKSRDILHQKMNYFDLIDVWRLMNPDNKQYTWRRRNPEIKYRLDYFLTSFNIVNKIKRVNIKPGFRTDHSLVILEILPDTEKRGSGSWKLNTSLLLDKDYVQKIKTIIKDSYELYASQNTNPNLIWELEKSDVRGESIKYSSFKKKQRVDKLKILERELQYLYEDYDENANENTRDKIDRLESEIKDLISHENKGIAIRSKLQWLSEGEKNSKYFMNLEKSNYNRKVIKMLKDENDCVITGKDEVLASQKYFFKKLYTSRKTDDINIDINDVFFPDTEHTVISTDGKHACERYISMDEIKEFILKMKNNKTPGVDGLPIEFYKIFWHDIKDILYQSYCYSFENNTLTISQKQGLITLLPKSGKDTHYLKNWRPISLLTVDYKILASTLATRVKTELKNLINDDQTGFVKGRYIGENIRKVLEIIEYSEIEDKPGVLISIDFEKAFDSLEWDFIFKTLKYFDFGDHFIDLVNLLYTDAKSCCMNNGWASEFFSLGCPLSPYLFILCAEILGNAIRSDKTIGGIKINVGSSEHETKLSQ